MLRTQEPGDDQGSVVMAVLVLLVLGGLTASMLAYSQSALRTTARSSQQEHALHGVDVAIAEAASRIERGEVADFRGSGTIGDIAYRYEARRTQSRQWQLYGEGSAATDGQPVTAAAAATMTGTYTAPNRFALFGVDSLNLTAGNAAVSAPIGSNGSVRLAGALAAVDTQLFTPGGACSGCTDAEIVPGPYPTQAPATPAGGRTCPLATLIESSGRRSTVIGFLGTLDGQRGVPYRCRFNADNPVFGHRPVIVYQTIKIVNPPLIIHVDDRVTLWFLRADVNPTGSADGFTIEAVGGPTSSGGFDFGQLWDDGLGMVGTLDAPQRRLTARSVDVRGSMTVGSMDYSADGSLSIVADPTVVDTTLDWELEDWHRVEVR